MIVGSFTIACDIKLSGKSICTNKLHTPPLHNPTAYREAIAFAIQKGWVTFREHDDRNNEKDIFICKEHIGWAR